MIQIHDPAQWQALLIQAERPPLEQGWAFGEAVSRCYRATRPTRWLLEADGQPVGFVQMLTRCGIAQVLRGPVWLDSPALAEAGARLKAFRRQLPWLRRQLLVLHPELPNDSDHHALLQGAGLRRIGGGYRTAWLDLTPPLAVLRQNLHATWRRGLAKAETVGAPISFITDFAQTRLFLLHYDAARRQRRIIGPERRFLQQLYLTHDRADFLLPVIRDGRHFRAGIVFLCHGQAATYYSAWRDPNAAPDASSHKLLLWEGIRVLQARGVRWLDLGGLPPDAPGVCQFKQGVGGAAVELAGIYW
jgi:hypothetical protein